MILILPIIFIIILIGASAYTNGGGRKDIMLKIVYTFLLAIFVALFVGVGIAAFYPMPKYPEYPTELEFAKSPDEYSTEQRASKIEFDSRQKTVREDQKVWARNASVIAIGASILLLILSLTLLNGVALISDGILTGGAFTLIYGTGVGFMSENGKFQFVIVTIGLIIALALGYLKLVKPDKIKAGS